jgi:leader peptidase (prepilin peptidase)/N-methyltransferase
MTTLRAIMFALFGLPIGSFLTVVVYRVPRRESIVRPRSACPECGTELRNLDNIPVLSWLLLRGRCRSCGTRISVVYPLVELTTAGLFVAASLVFDDLWVAVMMALFLALMPPIAVIDIRHRIIPNAITYPALVGFAAYLLVAAAFGAPVDLARAGIGFLSYGGVLLLIAIVVPGGMGIGDVKLVALIGLVLGSLGLRYVAVAAGAGILLGGIGSIVALAIGLGRKRAIPFGPYLAAGAMISAFFAEPITRAYLDLTLAG